MAVSTDVEKKPAGLVKATLVVFWALVIDAVLFPGLLIGRRNLPDSWQWTEYVWMTVGVLLIVLGIVLIILPIRAKIRGLLRLSLVLTGAATVGFLLFAVLHNLVYALFKSNFDSSGGDEGVLFIMAIIVCPAVMLISALGTMVLLAMGKHKQFM